ncbi:MAG: hypothetical protein H6577_21770 [Lewinellaceae bacterium]|nr:hypothetical protein [Saprospiraceae bacterium]MCB9340762.1 hypothetical protein [Lewinellaceae bacterium]
MNFLLDNLELELEESCLIAGEKLLEDGKVGQLTTHERNLWVAKVDQLEVEMHITPSRVKACSCECVAYMDSGMCGHIAAGLLALRKFISTRKEQRPNTAKRNQFYQKLTTASILQNIDSESLAAFVGQYAKSNRNFALAFKARFASAVPMYDNKEKYAQLLETTILAFRKKDDHISASGAIQLLKTVQELLGQADDAISLEHFAEGWAILQGILSKITPLLRKIEGEAERFNEQISVALVQVEALLSKPLPPALREEIGTFFLEECTRPAYRINDFSKRLFSVLNVLADDDDKAGIFLQTLDNELERKALPAAYHRVVLFAKLSVLEKPGLAGEADKFLVECLADTSLLMQVVESAIEHGKPQKVKSLAEKGLRFVKDGEDKMKLEGVLLSVSVTEKNPENIVQNARQLFLETYELEYFRLCKQHQLGDWALFFTKLEADLLKQNAPFETLAGLYAEEGCFEQLLDVLEKMGSLDSIYQYAQTLAKTHATGLLALYIKLLNSYLSNHLGIKPSLKVQGILSHLHQIGAPKIAEALVVFLKEKYPARLAPIEELEVI